MMQPTQVGGDWADHPDRVPSALECAIHNGHLADQIVGSRVLNGCGDLVLTLIDLGDEAPRARGERLREAGRRLAQLVHERLAQQLHSEWQCEDVAILPWEQFAQVVSQASERLGFGRLDFRIDEAAALVHVVGWSSPFPELLGGGQPACALVEGFCVTLIEAVGGSRLAVQESACRASGAPACQFVIGAEPTLRQFLSNR